MRLKHEPTTRKLTDGKRFREYRVQYSETCEECSSPLEAALQEIAEREQGEGE